jgi:hypothetical protein
MDTDFRRRFGEWTLRVRTRQDDGSVEKLTKLDVKTLYSVTEPYRQGGNNRLGLNTMLKMMWRIRISKA